MANDKNVLHVPITVREDSVDQDALEVVRSVKTEWKDSELKLKLLTDGITNKLVQCKPTDCQNEKESVLVRIFGNKTDLLIDRKAEYRNILLFNSVGLAPRLYATFENGLVYQFIPGCTLTDQTVRQPEIYRLVARKMANFHKVQVPGEESPKSTMWKKMEQFFNLVPDVYSDEAKQKLYVELIPPKRQLSEEITYLKTKLSSLGSPVVLAHNDLLLGNVIYTKENNSVSFIDFEYTAFNYQAFDIGNHFAEFVGLNEIDYSKFPSKELQYDWLRSYLAEYKGTEDVADQDVETLYSQVNKFVLLSHVFWGLWSLIQAEYSHIDFDFMRYAAIRLNEYFAKKETLLMELPQ